MDSSLGDAQNSTTAANGTHPVEASHDTDALGDLTTPSFEPLGDLNDCPEAPPSVGQACGALHLRCSYGESVRSDCRTTLDCEAGRWVSAPRADCRLAPADFCPPREPTGSCQPQGVDGTPIDTDAPFTCTYGEATFCYCRECPYGECSEGPGWECIAPPMEPLCPERVPNLGSPCTQQGVACSYGDPCLSGAERICRNGVWYPLEVLCHE